MERAAAPRRRVLRRRFVVVALTLAGIYLICPFRLELVQGHSMAPTLRPGELCLIDRSYYRRHPIRPGEIVVLRIRGAQTEEVWTKRVYGAPGETIRLLRCPGHGVYQLPELRKAQLARLCPAGRLETVSLKLRPDECFVVGDSDDSVDSRRLGPIYTRCIVARMITPLN